MLPTLFLYRLSQNKLANLARLGGVRFSQDGELLPRNEIARRIHGAMWNGAHPFSRREVNEKTGEIRLIAGEGRQIRIVHRRTGNEQRVQSVNIGRGTEYFVEVVLAPQEG